MTPKCGLVERSLHRKLVQPGNQLCDSKQVTLSPVYKMRRLDQISGFETEPLAQKCLVGKPGGRREAQAQVGHAPHSHSISSTIISAFICFALEFHKRVYLKKKPQYVIIKNKEFETT